MRIFGWCLELEIGRVVADRLKERMADPRAVWGIPWPFAGLNKLTGGIHRGEMTILAARPSVGKTAVMVQVADAVADYLQSPQARAAYPGTIKLVLHESTAEVFLRRWACLRAGVSQRRVQDGSLSQEQADRFLAELRTLAKLPIEYKDDAQSLEEVVGFLTGSPTVWWGLDYVQKCPLSPHKPNDGSVGPITLISGALTEVARLHAPGLVLAHTPREVDKREDRCENDARTMRPHLRVAPLGRDELGDLEGGVETLSEVGTHPKTHLCLSLLNSHISMCMYYLATSTEHSGVCVVGGALVSDVPCTSNSA